MWPTNDFTYDYEVLFWQLYVSFSFPFFFPVTNICFWYEDCYEKFLLHLHGLSLFKLFIRSSISFFCVYPFRDVKTLIVDMLHAAKPQGSWSQSTQEGALI